MAIGRTNAGGGNPLNFKVVGQAEPPASTSRNLIVYPFYQTTLTNNGVTFTDNGDGTVTANGTATALARFRPAHTKAPGLLWLEPGTYTASGCPSGGSDEGYRFEVWDNDGNASLVNDTGSGAVFTLTSGTHVRFNLLVGSGVTVSNLKFKPQLEKGFAGTAFVKYAQRENLIWVKSSTSVPGYTISGISNPTGAKTAGWVSIEATTGTVSGAPEFNAIRKNELLIKPKSAKQYLDDAWTAVDAYIYSAAGWAQFPG